LADNQCREGELVLVDAGGEYGGYITDITRTWPVNGKFTDPQRELYEMILKVQRSVVSLCREDADLSLDKLHRITETGLRDGLKSLGFNMEGNVCALVVKLPSNITLMYKGSRDIIPSPCRALYWSGCSRCPRTPKNRKANCRRVHHDRAVSNVKIVNEAFKH